MNHRIALLVLLLLALAPGSLSAQRFPPPPRPDQKTTGWTEDLRDRRGKELFVRNNTDEPMRITSITLYDCQNVKWGCYQWDPEIVLAPGQTKRVKVVEPDSDNFSMSFNWRYGTGGVRRSRTETPSASRPPRDRPSPAGTRRNPPSARPDSARPPSPPTGRVMVGDAPVDIDEVARRELAGTRTGIVVGIHHQGGIAALEAFGQPGSDAETALDADHLFAFPAFTELLIAATVEGLIDGGRVEPDAPISTYLPELSPRLGSITLPRLIDHTSGLDDAAPREGQSFDDALDDLDDRALTGPPGAVYSHSRYSFPLALRVIEAATGTPFPELAARAFLTPLAMRRSTFDPERAEELGLARGLLFDAEDAEAAERAVASGEWNGLPIFFTTAGDVLHFLSTWMQGELRGPTPSDVAAGVPDPYPGAPRFGNGVRLDLFYGHDRAFRRGWELGYGYVMEVVPATGTALVLWSVGRPPEATTEFVRGRIAAAVGIGDEFGIQRAPVESAWLGKEPEAWAGRYLSGEYMVELRHRDGELLFFTGREELPVSPGENGELEATLPDGRAALTFRFQLDDEGRRWVRLRDRAYLHMDDREGGRG